MRLITGRANCIIIIIIIIIIGIMTTLGAADVQDEIKNIVIRIPNTA